MEITPEQRAANREKRLKNAAYLNDSLTIQYTNGDENFYVISASAAADAIAAETAVSAE